MTDGDDRLAGVLLGTALGDALALPTEGMTARAIARRFGEFDRFRLWGRTGYVSDDTEQAALVAQSLARYPGDVGRFVRAFRRSLLGWFVRFPYGIGMATIRACVRIGLGLRRSGVDSAGNGAAMRAAVVGVFFVDRPREREAFGRALAEVTHRDPRAIEGALYVAELAAACARAGPGTPRGDCQEEARRVVTNEELGAALDRARDLDARGMEMAEAAGVLGTSGYVVHGVPLATFAFLRFGAEPLRALQAIIREGGDTDSTGAILGAWLGALHGTAGLPGDLIGLIHPGPFGPDHLLALASALTEARAGRPAMVPRYSAAAALGRNLALFPVILGHGFRRKLPF